LILIQTAHNKLRVAPAIQPRALSIIKGRAVDVTHYLLSGIATTWAFFLARIIAVGEKWLGGFEKHYGIKIFKI
jgi:hypothetical protein